MKRVHLRDMSLSFVPKERTDEWSVLFGPSTSTGYDFVLLVENETTKVSYQVEFGINSEGRLWGQVTPDNADAGPDALLLFDLKPFEARFSDNWGGPTVSIKQTSDGVVTAIEGFPTEQNKGFS